MAGCLCGAFIVAFTLVMLSARIDPQEIRGVRGLPSASWFINSCAQPRSVIFSKTPVSIEIAAGSFRHLLPRYRPLVERFQYIKRLMKRTRLFTRGHESLQ